MAATARRPRESRQSNTAFFTQQKPHDLHVHGAVVNLVVMQPRCLEKLRTAQRATAGAGLRARQAELAGGGRRRLLAQPAGEIDSILVPELLVEQHGNPEEGGRLTARQFRRTAAC